MLLVSPSFTSPKRNLNKLLSGFLQKYVGIAEGAGKRLIKEEGG